MIPLPKPKQLRYMSGVGQLKAQALEKLGVETVDDLIEYFPRDWTFASAVTPISAMELDERVVITGLIERVDFQPWRGGILYVTIEDASADCTLTFYHGGFLRHQLRAGVTISAFGTVKWHKGKKTLINPKFVIAQGVHDPDPFTGPTYPASAKISSESIKYIIRQIDGRTIDKLKPEYFDANMRRRLAIIQRAIAYITLHNPVDREQLKQAKRRIKFDELFFMQLGLALQRHQQQDCKSTKAMKWTQIYDATIRMCFPFVLTVAQRTVITEIVHDMEKAKPMNRLLQGDVDSGKTAVAMYAALLAVLNGTQVAIMAPTQILAEQHFNTFSAYLGDAVQCVLVTPQGLKRFYNFDPKDIIIGTTAILNKDVKFRKLGLIVIDEQHKFGVQQRLKLRKGKSPHCLVMTATPIPRTLAMTAFGDLDVSTIHKRLPGRGGVVTRWVREENRENAYEIIRKKMQAGEQVFWVCPRIGAGEALGAIMTHATLSMEIFPGFDIGLLHSKLPQGVKDRVVDDFRNYKLPMLVSTSIVEVGLDIPNATVMVVEEANRFGAAQLHQLRGRVGRGSGRSYCFLFSDITEEVAVERLELMTQTDDGFVIAEHDLKLRGPGEMFSTRQHGLPDLKLANIIDDYKLLMLAREIAFEMVEADPTLEQHKAIRTELKRKLADRIELGDTG